MPKKKTAQAIAVATTPQNSVPPDRVDQAVKWILTGDREFDVVSKIVKQWPDQDVPALMAAVSEHFCELVNIKNPDVVRGWAFAATQEIYRQAIEKRQPFVALQAVKRLMEIAGA